MACHGEGRPWPGDRLRRHPRGRAPGLGLAVGRGGPGAPAPGPPGRDPGDHRTRPAPRPPGPRGLRPGDAGGAPAVSRPDGFPTADVDVDVLADDRILAAVRQAGPWAALAYLAVVTASWA